MTQSEAVRSEQDRIEEIQKKVVGMYTEHPWPGVRDADEEMGWRLRLLGIKREDFEGKQVVELGCGTGQYAHWYAKNGASKVVGVDLSDGSLAIARRLAEENQLDNAEFIKRDILKLDLPDEQFDYAYSVGVLHHTGAPFEGFQQLVRITKPNGVVIVSLYNLFTRGQITLRQKVVNFFAGEDVDKRAQLGAKLFPLAMRNMSKRYQDANYEELAYDTFGIPHETCHTAQEVMRWFDATNIEYTGSFAPLRLRDYFYAFSLPEYQEFRRTFDGFPLIRWTGDFMGWFARTFMPNSRSGDVIFKRPGKFSMVVCQLIWAVFGLRIDMYTIAGRKRS